MKKYHLIPILSLLVQACSYTILIPSTPTASAPNALPTETIFVTSTLTPSITPTQPTPTFTGTPTFIYSGPTPTSTQTPLPTGTIGALVATQTTTISLQLFLTPQSPVFDSVKISGNQIIWGATCQANSIKVTSHIASGYSVTSVLLFTRLRDQTSGTTTDWNNGAIMDTDGRGTFTYDLSAKGIKYYKDFNIASVQYQLVATDARHQVVGRTQPYLNNLTIASCP